MKPYVKRPFCPGTTLCPSTNEETFDKIGTKKVHVSTGYNVGTRHNAGTKYNVGTRYKKCQNLTNQVPATSSSRYIPTKRRICHYLWRAKARPPLGALYLGNLTKDDRLGKI